MSFNVDLITDTGIELGAGISWATGDLLQSAIEIGESVTYSGVEAKRTTCRVEIIESLNQLFRYSETTGRAKLGYGVFSGSASFRGSTAFNSSSYEISIALFVDVALPRFGIKKPALSERAQNILKPDEFYQTYGDYFVLNYQRGAALLFVISIAINSQEEKQSFSGQLSASGALGSFSGSASGSTESKLESALNGKSYRISFDQFGGPRVDADVSTIQKAFESINNFANLVNQENSFNRSIEVVGYEYASGIDGVFATELRKLRLKQQFALDDLGSIIEKWEKILADINYVLQNPRLFDTNDIARLAEVKETYDNAVRLMKREAEFLRADHNHIVEQPSVPPVSLPSAKSTPLPPIVPPPSTQNTPKVFAYTGPSCTGQRFELNTDSINFSSELNDKMRSFEIVGDFGLNEWWISFYLDADRKGLFQTFNAPVRINVLRGKYQVFDIWEGKTLDLPIYHGLPLSSSIFIRRSESNSVQPRWYKLNDDLSNPFPMIG